MMAALSLTSCLKGYEDNFSESSSERINEAIEQAAKVLAGAQNGWRMEVYPNPTCDYGGYTVFAKFDGEQVTAMGEIFGPEVVSTSYYSITAENGPMLSFDTYNDVIHFFSDPSYGAQYGYGEAQYGLHGDSDFIVMSAEPDCVVLKGRVTGNKVRMYPIDSATDWAAEMEQYIDMADRMSLNYNRASIDGEDIAELFYESEYQGFTSRYFIFINDAGDEIHGPYIITKNGLKFYEPVTLGSHTVSEMTLVDDWYLSSDDGAVNIYSPEPIRSDNTFSIDVTDITFMEANVIVTPSNSDGYYFDVYEKSVIEGMRDRDVINALLGSLNSYIPTYTPDFVYSVLVSEGQDEYFVEDLIPETEYVVVAFGVSISNEGDRLVSTTGLTKYEFRTADMPPLDDEYAKWLGTWSATSTSSYVSQTSQTITGITIQVKRPNETYKVTNFSTLLLRDDYPVEAEFQASSKYIIFRNGQVVDNDGTYNYTYNGHFGGNYNYNHSILTGNYIAMFGETNGSTGVIYGNYVNSTWDIGGMEYFAIALTGSGFARFTAPAPGFTAYDYLTAPFTMRKTAEYSSVKVQAEPQTRAEVKSLGRGEKLKKFNHKIVVKALHDMEAAADAPVVYWSSYEAF